MQLTEFQKLDNPVWHSLCETHQAFSLTYKDKLKCYQPEYCVFGAFEQEEGISPYIDQYSALTNCFFIVGEKPPLSANLTLNREVLCHQMLLNKAVEVEIRAEIAELKTEHLTQLYDLIHFVYPGYFQRKTALLGTYFGIFEAGELIAVAGERLIMNDFAEISSVVTHPKHQGKGLAKQLTAHTANHIFSQQKTPYLHVWEKNVLAIQLYQKLGFEYRRAMSFWNVAKV
jgi:ribosomal protein S18 acetylase RimI-like enzyme